MMYSTTQKQIATLSRDVNCLARYAILVACDGLKTVSIITKILECFQESMIKIYHDYSKGFCIKFKYKICMYSFCYTFLLLSSSSSSISSFSRSAKSTPPGDSPLSAVFSSWRKLCKRLFLLTLHSTGLCSFK